MSNEVMQVLVAFISLLGIIATGIFSWKARKAAISAKDEAKAAKTEVVSAKEEVVAVKTEVAAVKTDVSEVAKKVIELATEVNGKVTKLLEAKDQETIAKETAALLTGEKKGAEDNQAKTDAKEQDKK